MSSPSVDGTATAIFSGTNTGTITLTTTQAGLVLIGIINEQTTTRTVNNVTGTLTWARVTGAQVIETGVGGTNVCLEVWAAVSSGALSAVTFTVNLSGNTDDTSLVAFGVKDLYSTADPYDSSGPVLATGSDTVTAPNLTYSTTQADDLLVWFGGGRDAHAGEGNPSGFTVVAVSNNTGGTFFSCLSVTYKSVSSVQTAQTATIASGYRGCELLIALTGDAKSQPLQTFVTIICT